MTGQALLVLAAVLVVAGRALLLWVRPYGRCRAAGCRNGRVAGSGEGAWGRCPRCHGNPVPRLGAAAVARLVGGKHGKRFW